MSSVSEKYTNYYTIVLRRWPYILNYKIYNNHNMQGNLHRFLHIQGMISKNFSSTLINNSKNSYNQKLTLKEVSYFSFYK